jgi:Protein of unknown function (DUF1769)
MFNMGNCPSVNSVPSSNVSRDISLLQRLFPDTFQVESISNDSDNNRNSSATLYANNGRLTLILVAVPKETSQSRVATALVMDGSDIKAVMKRQQSKPANGVSIKEEFVTADITLPGGSVLVLAPPNMLGNTAGRQRLAEMLTKYSDRPPQIGREQNGHSSARTVVAVEPQIDNGNRKISTSNPQEIADNSSTANDDVQKLPSFPTLDFRLLQEKGQLQPNFPLNSRTATPFETDLFKGKVLVLLRPQKPEQEDPYWNEKIWKHKQRRVIVQVQGKFKREPKGSLYAGGEISDPMKLGLLARG